MKKTLITTAILFVPSVAFANVVWPALYTETKINSIPIIGLSLLIEFYLYKWLFQLNYKKAFIVTIVANMVSGVIGLIGRPLSGLAYELSIGMLVNWLFDWGTFNPVAWCFVPVFSGSVNAIIELLAIRTIWKIKITKKTFLYALGANAITAAIATIWVVLQPPQL